MHKKMILIIGLLIIISAVIFFWQRTNPSPDVNLSNDYKAVEEPELVKDNLDNSVVDQQEAEPELDDNKIPSSVIDENNQEPELIRSYSIKDISQHNNKEDCWLAINGKIYNVTDFIASGDHPGGEAILQGCGQDATVLFETRPMGSGTPHSDSARVLLNNYYIGNLQQ